MIFKNIQEYDAYSVTLTGAQLRGSGRGLLYSFLIIKKSAEIREKKTLIVSILGLNFPFKILF